MFPPLGEDFIETNVGVITSIKEVELVWFVCLWRRRTWAEEPSKLEGDPDYEAPSGALSYKIRRF